MAQAWLSQARRERAGSSAATGSVPTPKSTSAGNLASLVDEGAGLTQQVLETRLALVELESTGPRLPADVALLVRQRPSLESPPPGAHANPRWREYVTYREQRLGELKKGATTKGPLRWEAYEQMRGWFARGLAFERFMVELLRADAALPKAQRRFLGDFDNPRIETYVGVWKPESGLRFADVLVIEQSLLPGRTPRVETFSFKSRDLSLLTEDALIAQLIADAREALVYYGETLNIRRPSLQRILPNVPHVPVRRVRLIYEESNHLKPKDFDLQKAAVDEAHNAFPEVEILFR